MFQSFSALFYFVLECRALRPLVSGLSIKAQGWLQACRQALEGEIAWAGR